MKYKVILVLLSALMMRSVAGTINWGSDNLGLSGYEAGWLVALYEDVNKDGWSASVIDPMTGETDSDDVFLAFTTTLVLNPKSSDYFWGDTFIAPGGALSLGDYVYSVLFNAPTLAEATQYQVTTMTTQGNSWYQLPVTDIDATYQTTAMSGWQAIPEPATALLFFLGAAGAWVIRRNRMQ